MAIKLICDFCGCEINGHNNAFYFLISKKIDANQIKTETKEQYTEVCKDCKNDFDKWRSVK